MELTSKTFLNLLEYVKIPNLSLVMNASAIVKFSRQSLTSTTVTV